MPGLRTTASLLAAMTLLAAPASATTPSIRNLPIAASVVRPALTARPGDDRDVTLDASATVVQGPASYRFTFGDGAIVGPQESPVASHTYTPGAWTATVTVTDARGTIATTSTVLTVRPANLNPVAGLRVIAPYGPGLRAVPADPSQVFTEPSVAIPTYLKSVTEPTFGTIETRVTGVTGATFPTSQGTGTWSIDARHHYSKDEPWSADGTLISIDNDGGFPTRLYLDGETYKVRYETCYPHRHGDDRWHPSPAHAHERISCSGDELAWIDVVKCVKTRSWSLPFWVHGIGASEGNVSQDGRFVALHDNSRVFVVDMDPQAPLAPYPASRIGPAFDMSNCGLSSCSVDWASISPSGKYVVIKYSGEHMRVLDVDPNTLALTPRPMPATSPRCYGTADQGFVYDLGHLDMALDPFDNNEDVMVGQDHCNNIGRTVSGQVIGSVVKVRLRDGKITSLTDPRCCGMTWGLSEAYSHHISCRNLQRPGWAYVTFMTQPGFRFSEEVVAVKLDGSKQVERLAHTHTDFDGCYRCEAHGVPSPDGRRVMFASNWINSCSTCGTSDDIKAYVADARPAAVPGAAPVAPYLVLADASGSADPDGSVKSYAFDFGDGVSYGPQIESLMPHLYNKGTFTLKTTVTDNQGARSTTSAQIAVVDGAISTAPLAALAAAPLAGVAPLAVTFDASASRDPEGKALTYQFDFGDGTGAASSSTAVVKHTYAAGAWHAQVIATDPTGLADTARVSVVVSPAGRDSIGTNKVGNPSFESDLTGWGGYGGGVLSRLAGGHSGSWCAKITGPASYVTFGMTDSPNWISKVVVPGTTYKVSAWVRSTGGGGVSRLLVREWLSGIQQGSATSPYVRLGTSWQQVTATITAAHVGSTIDLQVLDEPALTGEALLVDDVVISPQTAQVTLDSGDPAVSFAPPTVLPNPSFGHASLQLTMTQHGPLHVALYDAAGREVRVVADDADAPAGALQFEIDGRDRTGARLADGVYFYRVRTPARISTGRFVIAH